MLDSGRDLDRHDHALFAVAGPEGLDALAVATFGAARLRHERLVFISDDPRPERLAGLEGLDGLLDRGELVLAANQDLYRLGPPDPEALQATLVELVGQARADGYGLAVVADNTAFATGDEKLLTAWMAWEHAADRIGAAEPVMGVCAFDRHAVTRDRLTELSTLHPVVSTGGPQPPFRLYHDGDVAHLSGTVDAFATDRLRRVLATAPRTPVWTVDLSGLDFGDHRMLLALNEAPHCDRVVVRGVSPSLRRIWAVLEVADAKLTFA